ncbi:thiamine diphosphokinase [Rhodohalobacter mucosus]|uniref:Thiamine diphosphokinase n=1 Tax=Rhodohalobacter mucosus TaxID=2079485 RepID=A0A316TUI2_9BACT|nr:thiamine diphosphokinase [Rhodohalobacter mucosus]PWN08163.1 thiamine diphosphokinase [Rhodohalobacter mucosus]
MNAVILCDGTPPAADVLNRFLDNAFLFIAADGGALTARSMGLHPDVIIGDFDSFIPNGDEPGEIITDPDQETNDLEKALAYAIGKGAVSATVFGATGKRLDHTLKNLSVLKQFDHKFESLTFRDRYADIFLVHSPYQAELPIHTSVSLFPLSGRVTGITTRGFRYPLNNEDLENGIRDGTSNETIKNRVEIEFEKGDLLMFINHKTEEA